MGQVQRDVGDRGQLLRRGLWQVRGPRRGAHVGPPGDEGEERAGGAPVLGLPFWVRSPRDGPLREGRPPRGGVGHRREPRERGDPLAAQRQLRQKARDRGVRAGPKRRKHRLRLGPRGAAWNQQILGLRRHQVPQLFLFLSLSLSFSDALSLSFLSLVVAVTPPRSVARCPFQSDRPEAERTWCVWVGDVGNNAEWDKGTFMYVVEEPILGSSIHTSPIDRTPRPPTNPITLRLDYEGYGYFKGPNVEAIAVAPDGSRFWAFRKTTSHGGAGPAAVWESPTLTDRSALEEDDCRMIANSSWSCALSDRPNQFLISQKYGQAILVGGQPAFSVRSRDSARMGVSAPLRLQKIGSMPNPLGPKDKRNISGADLSLDGRALLIATYAGKSPPPHRSPYRF